MDVGGTRVAGGKWVHASAPKLEHYHLYIHSRNTKGEWLRDVTMTKLGRAMDMFAKFSVDDYELVPE